MADRVLNQGSGDPVAEVLVDFQTVMTQFLELQNDVIAALAKRPPQVLALEPFLLAEAGASVAATLPPAGESIAVPLDERIAAPAVGPEPPLVEPTAAREDCTVETPQAAFSRYTLNVRERPLRADPASLAPNHCVLVTDDGRGIAPILAEHLRRHDRRVAILSSHGRTDPNGDLFASALESAEEARAIVDRVVETCGPIAAVVHLAPLSDGPAFDSMDI